MYEKIDSFKAKLPWLFSSHYKIERFGIIFFLMVASLVFCFGMAHKQKADNTREQLSGQVMYTTGFNMSVSRANCTVSDVRVSEDKTKCFIMLKWSDMDNVVADASAYSVYVSGADTKGRYAALESRPTASIYMFGASGYMGIYLVDTNGFPSQIISLVLRSENNFVSDKGPIADTQGDSSFLTHDQARIYFNPGGTNSQTVACLEDNDMSAFNIYCSFFVNESEKQVKESMQKALDEMYKQVSVIDNALHVLLPQTGLQSPKAPVLINEVDNASAPYDTIFKFNDAGEPVDLLMPTELPNSVIFDWRGGSIEEGYSSEVLSKYNFRDLTSLLKTREGASSGASNFSTNVTWYDTSGVIYTASSSSSSPAEANRNTAISALTKAWQAYYSAKYQYQITLPVKLLTLERNAREVVALYTVKNDNVIWLY